MLLSRTVSTIFYNVLFSAIEVTPRLVVNHTPTVTILFRYTRVIL